jgi:hypothetical protein
MKNFSLNISFEQVTRLFHGERNEYRLHPHRDWAVLLLVILIVLVLMLAWSVYLFRGISNGSFFTQSANYLHGVDTVDRSRLDATLLEFKVREEQATLLESVPILPDPSQ